MSDPYRSQPSRPCPLCGMSLIQHDATYTCSKGCGEWLPQPLLRALTVAENVGEVLSFSGFKDAVAACPECRTEMEGWIWNNAVFRRCGRHGAWVEAWARTKFRANLAADDEREKQIRELAERLRSDDPAGRLELARRILALERRVELLEKK